MKDAKPKLYDPGGARLDAGPWAADFSAAERFGPFRVGALAFYYRAQLKQRCLPYADFDQVFRRATLCSARHCGGVSEMNSFSLVFCREGRELAEAKAIEEAPAAEAFERLRALLPEVRFGL